MIENAEVTFSNGNEVEAERVKFKNGGWIGVRAGESEWAYYPPDAVARVVDRDELTDEENTNDRPEPSRSEPADFGGGETTGVQDL